VAARVFDKTSLGLEYQASPSARSETSQDELVGEERLEPSISSV